MTSTHTLVSVNTHAIRGFQGETKTFQLTADGFTDNAKVWSATGTAHYHIANGPWTAGKEISLVLYKFGNLHYLVVGGVDAEHDTVGLTDCSVTEAIPAAYRPSQDRNMPGILIKIEGVYYMGAAMLDTNGILHFYTCSDAGVQKQQWPAHTHPGAHANSGWPTFVIPYVQ